MSFVSSKIRKDAPVWTFPELATMILSDDKKARLDGCRHLCDIVRSRDNPPYEELVAAGLVPRLLQFLTSPADPELQSSAGGVLGNLSSQTKWTKVLIENNAIPIFVQLLRSSNMAVQDDAAMALANLTVAEDGDEDPLAQQCRELALATGAMTELIWLIKQIGVHSSSTRVSSAIDAVAHLCQAQTQLQEDLVAQLLPLLGNAINYSRNDDLLSAACWSLAHLSEDTSPHKRKLQAFFPRTVAERIIQLSKSKEENVKTPALKIIKNIGLGAQRSTLPSSSSSVSSSSSSSSTASTRPVSVSHSAFAVDSEPLPDGFSLSSARFFAAKILRDLCPILAESAIPADVLQAVSCESLVAATCNAVRSNLRVITVMRATYDDRPRLKLYYTAQDKAETNDFIQRIFGECNCEEEYTTMKKDAEGYDSFFFNDENGSKSMYEDLCVRKINPFIDAAEVKRKKAKREEEEQKYTLQQNWPSPKEKEEEEEDKEEEDAV